MASNSYKSDSGAVYGQSYDVVIDGLTYVLKTVDHSLNISGITLKDNAGLFKGGAYVAQQETLQVEIDAISGTASPSQLVVFSKAFHGFASKYWMVHNLSIKSGNEAGRTYSAELKASIAAS